MALCVALHVDNGGKDPRLCLFGFSWQRPDNRLHDYQTVANQELDYDRASATSDGTHIDSDIVDLDLLPEPRSPRDQDVAIQLILSDQRVLSPPFFCRRDTTT